MTAAMTAAVAHAAAAQKTLSTETLRVSLSAELAQHFEALALIHSRTVEEEIALHLERTKSFTSVSPLYFDDAQAKELRSALGSAVTTPTKVIDMVRRLKLMKLGAYKVELSPAQQEALHWWIRSSGMNEDAALKMFWQQALGLMLKC